jgi:hypothetical protein
MGTSLNGFHIFAYWLASDKLMSRPSKLTFFFNISRFFCSTKGSGTMDLKILLNIHIWFLSTTILRPPDNSSWLHSPTWPNSLNILRRRLRAQIILYPSVQTRKTACFLQSYHKFGSFKLSTNLDLGKVKRCSTYLHIMKVFLWHNKCLGSRRHHDESSTLQVLLFRRKKNAKRILPTPKNVTDSN